MGMLDEAAPSDGQNGQNPDPLKALYIRELMGQTDPRQLDPTMVGSFADPAQQQIVSALVQANPTPRPPQLSPLQTAVLDHIAKGEAPNPDAIYTPPGQPLNQYYSYEHHPNVHVPIPGTDLYSAAAGPLQITEKTWEGLQKQLGPNMLPDFTPESQYVGGWHLADTTYRQKTGHSLMSDAAKGNVNWNALAGQWPSLKGSRPGPP